MKLSGLEAEIRESNLTGDIAVNTAGQQPYIRANLVSRKLYYNDFAALLAGQKNKTKTKEKIAKTQKAGKPEALPIDPKPRRAFDADINLKGQEIIAPSLSMQALAVDVALHVGRLTIEPFEVGIGGGMIRGTLVLDSRCEPSQYAGNNGIGRSSDEFRHVERPCRGAIVGANAKQIAAAQEQTPLTFIYSLAIEGTHFTYKEPHSDTAITVTVATRTTASHGKPITQA